MRYRSVCLLYVFADILAFTLFSPAIIFAARHAATARYCFGWLPVCLP